MWAGTFVGDGSLMRNISDLRRALALRGQPGCIETVPKRGYLFRADVQEIEHTQQPGRRTIAVLPLRVIGGDDDRLAALADATTEALITKLSSVRECMVHAPRGAIATHSDARAVAIGREFGVECVLDGSIRHHANKIRASVRLLPTAGGPALWAETLEEDCDDPFACEDAISDELAGALALILTSTERKLVARRYTESAAAYQMYLKGRLEWARRSGEGLRRAVEHFRRAINIDPEYALAHSAVASSYALLPMIAPVASATFMPRAKAAAVHALEIDDTLLEARSVLAFVKWHYDWNWRGAEREFRRMLKFAPSDAVACVWYALLLAERGDVHTAIAQARRAQSLDPRSCSIRANVSTVLHFCGRYDEAIDEATHAIETDAGSLRAHLIRGLALEQQNRVTEAVTACETAVAVSHATNPTALGALGHAYARNGSHAAAERVLKQLDDLEPEVTNVAKAVVRLALGDNRHAVRLLLRACDSREFYLVMLAVDRRLDPVRQASEFRVICERVGLGA